MEYINAFLNTKQERLNNNERGCYLSQAASP